MEFFFEYLWSYLPKFYFTYRWRFSVLVAESGRRLCLYLGSGAPIEGRRPRLPKTDPFPFQCRKNKLTQSGHHNFIIPLVMALVRLSLCRSWFSSVKNQIQGFVVSPESREAQLAAIDFALQALRSLNISAPESWSMVYRDHDVHFVLIIITMDRRKESMLLRYGSSTSCAS